ncbi:MAG: hypothetical protein K2Y17_07905 [Qipengyuania sp.]|nr:hypothetical protein [Qipengyuania sp.]
MSTIDLNSPPPNHKFSVSLDREETVAERNVRLFKDVALFVVALAFAVIVAWICVSTLQSSTASADAQKWAMSTLTAITGGMIEAPGHERPGPASAA